MEPKVLLIYPPNQLMPKEFPRPDGSLGLLYLAGALERVGIEVYVLDASVGTLDDSLEETFNRHVMQSNCLIRIGMTTERISEVIANGGYNVVGINSNFTPQTKMALEVAKATKDVSEDILVIAGGVNSRSLPERFLVGDDDVVCNTEGENVVINIVRTWEQERDLEVSGTISMKNGKIVRRSPQPDDVLMDLDGLPFPAWHKLPWAHYENVGVASAGRSFLKDNDRLASLMTSRGCPFECAYCHISMEKGHSEASGGMGALRLKSVGRVMEEVGRLRELGVSRIFFEDDSLLAHKARVKEIFTQVTRLGIICPINMMIGFPDETEEEILSSIELGRQLVLSGAPYCSLFIPIPFPGSMLFKMALREGYLQPDFNTDAFNWRTPVMRNTTVSSERIVELQREGWININPPEYIRKRLEVGIGRRWKSGEPETA